MTGIEPSKPDATCRAPSKATRVLLVMLQLPGIGVGTVRKLTERRSPFAHLNAVPLESLQLSDAGARELSPSIEERATREVSALVEQCAEHAISILSVADPEYPDTLRNIPDYPPILYVKGEIEALRSKCVAVVGTRKASELGQQWSYKISKSLASGAVTVVSGLALGIDTYAHKGALAAGGTTIAVLAHGLDTVAPTSNRKLAEEILEHEGALISEHPPGTPPRPPEFVRRNRIQSGLSVASIIVESDAEGGAIHQANFTKQQKRALFVVLPSRELREKYAFRDGGARTLMERHNAQPIANQDDLSAGMSAVFKLPWITAKEEQTQLSFGNDEGSGL